MIWSLELTGVVYFERENGIFQQTPESVDLHSRSRRQTQKVESVTRKVESVPDFAPLLNFRILRMQDVDVYEIHIFLFGGLDSCVVNVAFGSMNTRQKQQLFQSTGVSAVHS